MANTKIPVELSSTPGIVDNSNATAITIDSSENVGIGNTVASSMDAGGNNLVVGTGSGTEGMTIYSGTANSGVIYFADGASGDDRFRGQIGYSHSDNAFSFRTNAAASANMVLDSSGNVGIGTTSVSQRLDVQTSTVNTGMLVYNTNTASGASVPVFLASESDGSTTNVSVENAGAGNMVFRTGATTKAGYGTERMRIDASGIVSIGNTNNTGSVLNVNHSTTGTYPKASGIGLGATSTAYTVSSNGGTVSFTGGVGLYAENTAASGNPTNLVFWTNHAGTPAEAMRIDSLGNLLVGATSGDAWLATSGKYVQLGSTYPFAATNNSIVGILNRTGTDGTILEFKKDANVVGSIATSNSGTYLYFGNSAGSVGLGYGGGFVFPTSGGTSGSDNAKDLGSGSYRWQDIHATNGTIQTSDRNEKQDIAELLDAETRVAVAAKGLLRKFRWQSAVEEKGDEARIHFGIIAQDLQDAFTAEGLDAGDYAMFISSTWTDDDGVEQTRLGVRYSELLAFIIAAI